MADMLVKLYTLPEITPLLARLKSGDIEVRGKALLLACLHAMAHRRYAYAVIGWAGPTEFYAKAVGATIIEDSEPGIYRGPLIG